MPLVSRRHLVGLIAILLLATAVRFQDISRHSMWLDEFLALGHSAGQGDQGFFAQPPLAVSGVRAPPPDVTGRWGMAPYSHIWRGMAHDVHPPLYPVLLRLWRDGTKGPIGDSDAVIRALGALLGVAGVLVLWDVVRLLHGPAPALWAALIMALAMPQIQWAQDARPYTLVALLALGAIDAVIRLERLGPRMRLGIPLALCTLGAALTHYYALPALFALGCYAAIRLRGRARVQAGGAMLLGVAFFGAIWGSTLVDHVRGGEVHASYLADNRPGHVRRTLAQLALLPARSLNEPSPRVAPVASLGAIVFVLPLLLSHRRPELTVWGWWMAGAIAPALAIDLLKRWGQMDLLRYTSLAMPAFYAIIATVVGGMQRGGRAGWLRHVVPAAASLSCVLSLPLAYSNTQTPKPDYPWLASNFAKRVGPDDVLVFHHAYDRGSPVLWYMAMNWYVPPGKMPTIVVFLMGEPNAHEAQVLRNAANVWTVAEVGGSLPAGITAGRALGYGSSGFNLPALQQWTPLPPATTRASR